MEFGEKLAKVRKEKGFTQKQLAEEMGVYQKDISRWEQGKIEPGVFTLKKICEILGASADELLEIK